jgi:hypothetical protein
VNNKVGRSRKNEASVDLMFSGERFFVGKGRPFFLME